MITVIVFVAVTQWSCLEVLCRGKQGTGQEGGYLVMAVVVVMVTVEPLTLVIVMALVGSEGIKIGKEWVEREGKGEVQREGQRH